MHSDGLRFHPFLPIDLIAVADSDFEFSFGFFLDVSHCTSLSALPRTISAAVPIVCILISVFLVYAVGFACSLDALDGSLRNFILFTKFGNFAGQHCSTVCQFRRGILSAHLLDDFRPLCVKSFYLLGQALAESTIACKDGNWWSWTKACSARIFSVSFQMRSSSGRLMRGCCFLGRIPN